MVFSMGEPEAADEDRITLRPEPLFSRTPLVVLASLVVGGLLGAATAGSRGLQGSNFLVGYGVVLFVIAAILVAPRLLNRAALRDRAIAFHEQEFVLPAAGGRLRPVDIPYDELRSVSVAGQGKRARLLIDFGKRVLLLPIRDFVEPADAERFVRSLRQRITATPEGVQRWTEMEARQRTAQHFAAIRPIACWTTLALATLIWLAQILRPSSDGLGALDFGANASLLVGQGQWFRLVTANLLHGGLLHLFSNALFAWVIGSLVERQMGYARFLLVVMVTGIASQAASALYAAHFSHAVYSVGLSGALMGLLGAQAALNFRFGRQLPGGYRFPARSWWSILLINFVFVPLRVANVDNAAHVGGLVSGVLVGWVLCQGIEPGKKVETGWTRGPLAAMAALWLIAVAIAGFHLFDPAMRFSDRAALAEALVDSPKSNAVLDNSLAWTVATSRAADPRQLAVAHRLAQRAVAQSKGAPQMVDTLATTEDRLGNLDRAIALERPLIKKDAVFPAQLARFLDHRLRREGPLLIGLSGGDRPLVAWTQPGEARSPLHVEVKGAYPKGVELWLLVERHESLLGAVRIILPKSSAEIAVQGGQDLPLDNTSLRVALVDAGGSCDCNDLDPTAFFYPTKDEIRDLP